MIHAHLDTIADKNVVGFECGTRADFDQRHAGDPLWVFLDYGDVKGSVVLTDFLVTPALYYLDSHDNLQRRIVANSGSETVQ